MRLDEDLHYRKISSHEIAVQFSDHQQRSGYELGPWREPRPPLPAAADFSLYKALQSFTH
jgi:hypothetical protein